MAVLINGDGHTDISAQNEAEFYVGMVGFDTVVISSGEEVRAEIVSNNLITLHDGEIISQGRRIQIPAGTFDEFTIENGSQGIVRYDILGYRFLRDESSNEYVQQFVQKDVGEGGVLTEATIRDGATECLIGVYRIKINGLTIEEVQPLFDIIPPLGLPGVRIIESGVVSGVNFEKRSDGIMRLWRSYVMPSIVLRKADGYLFYGESVNIVFPLTFKGIPQVQVTLAHSNVALFTACEAIAKSGFSFWPYGVKNTTAASPTICWEAVGRWE